MRIPLLVSWLPTLAFAVGTCPFIGPAFPTPSSLRTDEGFQQSLDDLQTALTEALSSGNSIYGPINPNDTYSIQIFSARDEKPLLDFHRRGTNVVGNASIDGHSIYRIASTTKLLTVYLLLLQAGDQVFNDPVTQYVPELVHDPQWAGVTIGSLAGYVSGVTTEPYGVENIGGGIPARYPDAFPPLEPTERPACGYGRPGCTRDIFLKHIATRRPIHLPNTTPAYSNTAFALLGLALESATGLSYEQSLQKLLVKPLNLQGTSAEQPKDSSNGVIVVDETTAGWNMVIDGAGIGTGAMFSTPNDMATIGRAMLSSSLLPGNTTRAWMKPTSHTSSLIGAVGRPWEIFRAGIGPPDNNRVVDLYTKSGNFQGYGAKLVLIPDYDVGFVVMMAGLRGTTGDEISSIIIERLLPALEEAARGEAEKKYAGIYLGSNGLNSSISLTSAKGVPGLSISSWVSNGTDMLRIFGSPKYFQMYPTNIREDNGSKISWRSSFISIPDVSPFFACPSWVGLDRPTHGVYGIDEFVFHLDKQGIAIGVEPKALKVVLQRQ